MILCSIGIIYFLQSSSDWLVMSIVNQCLSDNFDRWLMSRWICMSMMLLFCNWILPAQHPKARLPFSLSFKFHRGFIEVSFHASKPFFLFHQKKSENKMKIKKIMDLFLNSDCLTRASNAVIVDQKKKVMRLLFMWIIYDLINFFKVFLSIVMATEG